MKKIRFFSLIFISALAVACNNDGEVDVVINKDSVEKTVETVADSVESKGGRLLDSIDVRIDTDGDTTDRN